MKRINLVRMFVALAALATFDALGDEFVSAGFMNVRRFEHVSTLLPDGTVLITGGHSDNNTALSSAEIYHPSTRTFTFTAGSMHRDRSDHAAVLLHDGTVLVVGGFDIFQDPPPPAEIYDPATETFTEVGRPVAERYQFTAAVLPSGKVVLAGGQGCCRVFSNGSMSSTSLNTVEIYDPDTQSFSPASPLSDYYGSAAWAPLSNGGIIIAGGGYLQYDDDELVGPVFLSTADVLDPSTLEFSRTSGSMSVSRSNDNAALLPDGKVLVAYGDVLPNGGNLPPTAELYDPATDQFVDAGAPPADDRLSDPVVTLHDGRILYVGGYDVTTGIFSDTADIYDPAQHAFTTVAARMSTPRWLHQATTLEDGTVLITGGKGMFNNPLIGAELFVPSPGVADAIFSDGFESANAINAIHAGEKSVLDAQPSACDDIHFAAPAAWRGVVQVWQLPDGTRCIRR